MNVNVITTDNFRREAKKLIKKYQSLKKELKELSDDLENDPRKGILIGPDTYKIRLAVKSKGKGKSGGMRIITYVHIEIEQESEEETNVYLLSIYDKSDFENISDKLLRNLIEEVQSEIKEDKKEAHQTEELGEDIEESEEDSENDKDENGN